MIIDYAYLGHAPDLMLLAETPEGVCALLLGDEKTALLEQLQACFAKAELVEKAQLRFAQSTLDYLQAPQTQALPPLHLIGSAFQQQVWRALGQIAYGQTLSYRQLAENIAKPKAIRAVASACAANKIAILIPCHRVIASNGKLSGYRWGLERKSKLLVDEKLLAK